MCKIRIDISARGAIAPKIYGAIALLHKDFRKLNSRKLTVKKNINPDSSLCT
ncbi:MAG: hypothetical protein GDA48_05550 [Hormoscilla sp. GM102CHS1]|nr:hypothetical protein [Hormoscilla sp. GM102CHS1]